jgi:hypothetical protein
MRNSTYTSVYNANFDAFADNSLCPELIHLRHDVWGECVGGIVLPLGQLGPVGGHTSPDHLIVGQVVDAKRPYSLDTGQGQKVDRVGFGRIGGVQSDRGTFEDGRVERFARLTQGTGLAGEARSVLLARDTSQSPRGRAGLGGGNTWSSANSTI